MWAFYWSFAEFRPFLSDEEIICIYIYIDLYLTHSKFGLDGGFWVLRGGRRAAKDGAGGRRALDGKRGSTRSSMWEW